MPSHLVTITLSNEFSDTTIPNKDFDARVRGQPFVNTGSVASNPFDVASKSAVANSGGIYESHSDGLETPLEGVVGYTLPGGQEVLVIYFSHSTATILSVKGEAESMTEQLMVKARKDPKDSEEGAFIVGKVVYNYTIKIQTTKTGSVLQAKVNMTCSKAN